MCDNKAAALMCSVSLGALDALMQLESPKTARWNRLANAVEQVNRCVDLYRLSAFDTDDMDNASLLIDLVNDKIKELYP